MSSAWVGVGSNIEPERNVRAGLSAMRKRLRVLRLSTFYRVPAIGPAAPDYFNGVVELETDLPPRRLKQELRKIEEALGRGRRADRFAPRIIDLDLLLYDNQIIHEPDLVLPDPKICERAFLAIPLFELAPDLRLPGSGRSVREVAEELRGEPMTPLVQYTALLRQEAGHGP